MGRQTGSPPRRRLRIGSNTSPSNVVVSPENHPYPGKTFLTRVPQAYKPEYSTRARPPSDSDF